MEDQTEENTKSDCPYCYNSSGECQHLLLDYDASFLEYLSGYLARDSEELENLKSLILELIQSAKKPVLKDGYIKDIWDCAVEYYKPNSVEIDFDETAYFNLLQEMIEYFGGESFSYEGDDGAPGYSSNYIIYYAENPLETIRKINLYIIEQLKG